MNTDMDFKSLWSSQSTPAIPDIKEIFQKAAALKRKTRNKLILTNALLAGTTAFIMWIVLYYKTEMITTKIGALLAILSMVTYLAVANQLFKRLSPKSIENDAKKFLDEMIVLKQKEEFLQKTMMAIYFILLTSGLCLYMIEFARRMTLLSAIMTYASMLSWMALNWFYTRKRRINKQNAEINEVIESLKEASEN